jgi:hypothetical protein
MVSLAPWLCAIIFTVGTCLALPGSAGGQNPPPLDAAQSPAGTPASPAQTIGELAKAVRNPFAAEIQVQFSNGFDFGAAGGNGLLYTFTLQPIIPFKLTDSWSLITQSVWPISSIPGSAGSGRITGTGDSNIQFYFSPERTTPFIWGFGPVLGIPTASNSLLGSGKWTLGPGFAIIRQTEHWTYGVLVNQFWSFAGGKNRGSVSLTFIQATVSFTWKNGWSLTLESQSTYNANASAGDRWTVPLEMLVSKIEKFGTRPVNLSFAVIPYAVAPSASPSVGLCLTITPLFPKNR